MICVATGDDLALSSKQLPSLEEVQRVPERRWRPIGSTKININLR